MSDQTPPIPGHPPYERSLRRAMAELQPETRAAWRTRYLSDQGAELRVMALVERAEAALRHTGQPTTIRTLWLALADRAMKEQDGDIRAAAGLAGMALGLGAN